MLVKVADSVGELFAPQDATVAWTFSAVETTCVLSLDRKVARNLIGASHAIARNLLARVRVGGKIAASVALKTATSDESILPSVTVSIGAAQLQTSANAAALLCDAEAALRVAGSMGGNRACSG